MATVHLTKVFIDGLSKLRDAEARKVKEALCDAYIRGAIKLPLSDHGENRIPQVEKYKVSNGDRLVVQVIDVKAGVRVFLFTGTHDETEKWLNNNKGHRWVARNSDNKLDFVQVSETVKKENEGQEVMNSPLSAQLNSESQGSTHPANQVALPNGPLLDFLGPDDWDSFSLKKETRDFLSEIDYEFMRNREEEVLDKLPQLESEKRANLLYDLLCHAAKGEYDAVRQRLALHKDEARVVDGAELVSVAQEPVNTENLITFDDANVLQDFVQKGGTLAEWMYFLHPSQRELVNREFNGPARLRGVSGSGKTCVLLHRARKLARDYKEKVLVVTLTESMRRLLDTLLDDLCGVERQLIETSTVSSIIRGIVSRAVGPYRQVNRASDHDLDELVGRILNIIREHPGFNAGPLRNINSADLHKFVSDEFAYIRSRLLKADYSRYLDTESFQRRGRVLALARPAREAILDGLFDFELQLEKLHAADQEAITQYARSAVMTPALAGETYRSIFIDEVQDLSQMELETIANLKTPSGELVRLAPNGLFLVGDGTQTIYRKGFRLNAAGIQITGRSYLLKKNYRNTQEILRAAYALVANYEFADSDEGDVVRPLEPDYASRYGPRPMLVKCQNPDEEAKYVVVTISSLCAMSLTPGQICVIGCNHTVRDAIQKLLAETDLPFTSLRDDVRVDSEKIKISTIESAKGHEFHTVFIAGLVDGVIPPRGTDENEVSREASRLYVAMTRARDDLHLSFSPTRDFPASRFLLHVADHCAEGFLVDGTLREV
jgi:superfamily I DNA/RNA helicase